jgi:hypothetical protein
MVVIMKNMKYLFFYSLDDDKGRKFLNKLEKFFICNFFTFEMAGGYFFIIGDAKSMLCQSIDIKTYWSMVMSRFISETQFFIQPLKRSSIF